MTTKTLLIAGLLIASTASSQACSPILDREDRRRESILSFEGRVIKTETVFSPDKYIRATVQVTKVIKGNVPSIFLVKGLSYKKSSNNPCPENPRELEELRQKGDLLEFNLGRNGLLEPEPTVSLWFSMIWVDRSGN